jgi:hypothetical protein
MDYLILSSPDGQRLSDGYDRSSCSYVLCSSAYDVSLFSSEQARAFTTNRVEARHLLSGILERPKTEKYW